MKHYYSDDGILNFVPKRELLVGLAEAIGFNSLDDETATADILYCLINKACGLLTSYECSRTMAGLGGCVSVDKFFAADMKDPIDASLKLLLKNVVDDDVIAGYFVTVVMNAYFEILLNMRIGD